VEHWAEGVGGTCGKPIGKLHFYHTGDGTFDEGTAPDDCFYKDGDPIDCYAWNALADGFPTMLCPSGGCQNTRINYCENEPGQCKWNSCTEGSE
jgi:hypothetical protein